MPGGAPLAQKRSSAKRPCKYGPRDSQGRCPKKPKSASSGRASSSSKPPCKYGPRDSNGRCPKKPKAAKADKGPSVKRLKSVDGAARQAGEVLRSSKATRQQKHEAVKVLGAAVAAESGKKVADHVVREAKKAINKPAARAALKKAAPRALKAIGALTYTGAILTLGAAALDAERGRQAKKFADRELATARKRLRPQELTQEQAQTLYNQYYEYAFKQPVQNSYLGK